MVRGIRTTFNCVTLMNGMSQTLVRDGQGSPLPKMFFKKILGFANRQIT